MAASDAGHSPAYNKTVGEIRNLRESIVGYKNNV